MHANNANDTTLLALVYKSTVSSGRSLWMLAYAATLLMHVAPLHNPRMQCHCGVLQKEV